MWKYAKGWEERRRMYRWLTLFKRSNR